MGSDPKRTRTFVLRGLALGALLGSVTGAWTTSTQRPPPGLEVESPRPAAIERCPEGYTRAAQFDPATVMDGTAARWLARCDPSRSDAPISESLEILWSNRLYLEARSRGPALSEFVRTVAQEDHLLLEPLHEVTGVTVRGVLATVTEADGALRLPPMAVRVWLLPAGGSTVEVTVMATREQLANASDAARSAIRNIRGLAAWSDAADTERRWTIEARCPDGYTDATPQDGGLARSVYVGRYCLAPNALGGAEVVISQMPGPARDNAGVHRVLDLAIASTRAVGVSTGAGFGPIERERAGDFDVATSQMEIDTPSARIHLRAYLVPAGDATVYALATSMFDHADAARTTLEQWVASTAPVRDYDPAILQRYKTRRMVGGIVFPTLITAALGALIALALAKGRL